MRRQSSTLQSVGHAPVPHAASGRILQRKCACGRNTSGGGDCGACERKARRLQRRADGRGRDAGLGGDTYAVPDSVHEVLRSPGRPLDAPARAFFESRFGHDFSRVRVHTDARAAESAADVNASAYTVGADIAFAQGEYVPGTAAGRLLLAHELTHVLQQRGGSAGARPGVGRPTDPLEDEADRSAERVLRAGGGDSATPAPARSAGLHAPGVSARGAARLQRKIKMKRENRWWEFGDHWKDLSQKDQENFLNKRFKTKKERQRAKAVLDDMADSSDDFNFEDEDELFTEIFKRLRTTELMQETQESGPLGKSFGYPDRGSNPRCGPRVNKAAKAYWGPMQDDYYFELSEAGKKNAYEALKTLFTPQKDKCDRTLIHCDYLASVVHMRVFAEAVGTREFNERVKKGTVPLVLNWNGFDDIMVGTLRSSSRESLQEVRPSSEKDLVIGDHVIFWNHRAYDLINKKVGEAWRLENAVLEEKQKDGQDIFEGHGSGRHTNEGMRRELLKRFNEVVKKALDLIGETRSKNKATGESARKKMRATFPYVVEVGAEWRIKGTAHSKTFDEKLKPVADVNDPQLIGLRDPDDPSKMNYVKRPKESA